MARPWLLREFREADAREVASWATSGAEVRRWAGSDPGWPVDVSVFARWHAAPEVRPYVLSDGRKPVGYGEVWIDEPEQEVELARIIVSPDHRCRGLGQRLVRLLLEQASPAGLPDAFVRVVPENESALACYRSAGFSPVSKPERKDFNREQPVDYIWMHHPLA